MTVPSLPGAQAVSPADEENSLMQGHMPEVDPQAVRESLARHSASPEITVQQYVGELMFALGEQISSRKRLYLDTRYWILLRDAAMGRPRRPQHLDMLGRIRGLVRQGAAICPVSDAAWMELSKQTDLETHGATADLIDELSLGVALQSEHERVVAELEQFITKPTVSTPSPVLKNRVWVKAGYVLGTLMPTSALLSPEQNSLIQKSSVDLFWNVTLRQMADRVGSVAPIPDDFAHSAERINAAMQRYAHEIRSIQQAFAAESAGVLSVFEDEIRTLVLRHFRETTGDRSSLPDAQAEDAGKATLNALSNAFRLRPKVMAQRIPTVFAYAMCHAAVRMDKRRKFDGHDLVDIHHAACGIPYHDAVLTETPLRVLVTGGNVALDKTFGCTVLSRDDEVLDYLDQLA